MLVALELSGNASSIHGEGRKAHALLDDAREIISGALGAIAPMVVFTSGGSEANNLALKGAPVRRLIVSAIEHPSVLESAKASDKRPTPPHTGTGCPRAAAGSRTPRSFPAVASTDVGVAGCP